MRQIVLLLLSSATLCFAQDYSGTISRPDAFGNRHINYNNGFSGTISRPDAFGNSYTRYNDGSEYRFTQPDAFGNRHFQQTMPRRGNW